MQPRSPHLDARMPNDVRSTRYHITPHCAYIFGRHLESRVHFFQDSQNIFSLGNHDLTLQVQDWLYAG